MMSALKARLIRYRRVLVVGLNFAFVVASNYSALLMRFDGAIPPSYIGLWRETLPTLLAVRGGVFLAFGLYQGMWRYTSIWDLRNLVASVTLSSAAFYLIVRGVLGATSYPRSVFMIDTLLLICVMGGARLSSRVYRELRVPSGRRRILIYGAGDAGEIIAREMRSNPASGYEPVAFVDDDREKVGERIHGVPILGTRRDLPALIDRKKPDEIVVAIARRDFAAVRDLVRSLEPYKIPIKTLPAMSDLIGGRVTVSQLRSLNVEDLLPRSAVGLDAAPLRALIAGKRVMVTGAGGSIGSELARQIAGFEPESLMLFERYENGLYTIATELNDGDFRCRILPFIGDITDEARLQAILERHRPDLVFHAAAHKHVPLMEENPCEAVKNNVRGTRLVATAAARAGAERFILISSDKAVNPSSVMGTTKRVAELMVQTLNGTSHTSFAAVRFGNVLGSNGSVVPRFLDQIKTGGPVTVTHREMRRYFMLIPEASQLVLHAACLATGENALYVLDMGEQVNLSDLARNLIRLSGYIPDEEIKIEYIGLRPGEKLYEELVGVDEIVEPSGIDKVMKVTQLAPIHLGLLRAQVAELEQLALDGNDAAVLRQLRSIVPGFVTPALVPARAHLREDDEQAVASA